MVIEACAKINWTLRVMGQREDGYHLLDMLMQPVSLCDRIGLVPSKDLSLRVLGEGGAEMEGPVERNLAWRAARLLREAAGREDGAEILLTKRIPARAGMGGGSADAAGVLVGLNRLWGTGLSGAELEALGLRLGADVPFLIRGGLARCQGIGEKITSVPCSRFCPMIVLQPAEGLSTAAVFQAYHAEVAAQGAPGPDQQTVDAWQEAALAAILAGRPGESRDAFFNALEPVSRRLLPEISEMISALEESGAELAMMTGSGSAVFGIFQSPEKRDEAFARLSPRYPRLWALETRRDSVRIIED